MLLIAMNIVKPTVSRAQSRGAGLAMTGALVVVGGGYYLAKNIKKNKVSIKNKKIESAKLLNGDGGELKELEIGQTYYLGIEATATNGKIYSTAPEENATPYSDWVLSSPDIEIGGYSSNRLSLSGLMSDLTSIKIIATSSFDSDVKFVFDLPIQQIQSVEINVLTDGKLTVPNASFRFQTLPVYDNEVKGESLSVSEANDLFNVEIQGGSIKEGDYWVTIDQFPFGANKDDQIIIKIKDKKSGELLGIKKVPLSYNVELNYSFGGRHGLAGNDADDATTDRGPGNGGRAQNGGNGKSISVLMDVYNYPSGGETMILCKIIDNETGETMKFLTHPKDMTVHIKANGGNGGEGGTGGDVNSYSDQYNTFRPSGNGGEGGDGGDGGTILVQISPEANALNPNVKFYNFGGNGGNGGRAGSTGGSLNLARGSTGQDGYNGQNGPKVNMIVGDVKIDY